MLEALIGVPHEVHLVTGDDGYWQLIANLWARGDSFVLVEHDIVTSKEAIEDLVDCPEPWCACMYPYGRGTIVGLGCTKFTRQIIQAVPDALERAGLVWDRLHKPKHWCRLDASLQRVLVDSGYLMHFQGHHTVGHLCGTGSAHGCR